jgi:hypothetical protein
MRSNRSVVLRVFGLILWGLLWFGVTRVARAAETTYTIAFPDCPQIVTSGPPDKLVLTCVRTALTTPPAPACTVPSSPSTINSTKTYTVTVTCKAGARCTVSMAP